MRSLVLLLLLVLIAFESVGARGAAAQGSSPTAQLPQCDQRATFLTQPWLPTGVACEEEVINDPSAGELAFTALATAPDGTLYAARPLAGEVLALTDTDGDGLPDSPQVVASGLTLPNGLDYYDGALYVSGGSHIYRLRDGVLDTLVSDLPSGGGGFWTGGIAVGGDGRLYVATGAPCDFCVSPDTARGAVLSFAPDGSDRQIVATGLRDPADLAFDGGDLYVVDSAPYYLFDYFYGDEIDRVQPGANFGFPNCEGWHSLRDAHFVECSNATSPVISLPTASTPTGIAAYRGDAIPTLQGKLLVALSGSYNDLDLRGYQIVTADVQNGTFQPFIPSRPDNSPASDFTIDEMNYRGSGFFPHRPLDVTVTEQGWVYISVSGGRILALRP